MSRRKQTSGHSQSDSSAASDGSGSGYGSEKQPPLSTVGRRRLGGILRAVTKPLTGHHQPETAGLAREGRVAPETPQSFESVLLGPPRLYPPLASEISRSESFPVLLLIGFIFGVFSPSLFQQSLMILVFGWSSL